MIQKTLKYTFSLFLLLCSVSLFSQKLDWNGINVGADLSRFALPFIDSTRIGWEASGDIEILENLYAVAEVGSQTTNLKSEKYKYNANGAYFRLGVDYNYMKHLDPDCNDLLLVGARYGQTTFFHDAENITLEDEVWGNLSNGTIDRNWLTAGWMEITTGMRAHLFNNFYLGWNVRFKIKLYEQNDPKMQAFHIPGYGRGWKDNSVGMNYSLYYKIPLFKKKTVPKE